MRFTIFAVLMSVSLGASAMACSTMTKLASDAMFIVQAEYTQEEKQHHTKMVTLKRGPEAGEYFKQMLNKAEQEPVYRSKSNKVREVTGFTRSEVSQCVVSSSHENMR